MNLDLVIFDCDGVLIDSEIIACRIDAEELTRIGYPCTTDDVVRRFAGMSGKEMFATIEAELGAVPEGFHEHCLERLMAAFAAELATIPGIPGAIDRVEALGLGTCVASGSGLARLRHTLGLTGLWDRFEGRVFSSEMVPRGKPAPDLFLLAAGEMGARPGRCLVVEDSTAGVTAARAAGMAVLGFDGGSHCVADHRERLHAAGAPEVFSDMAALVARVGALAR